MAAKRLKLTSTSADSAAVQAAAQVLRSGGLAVVPMETIYGALARIDHAGALARFRQLRPNGREHAVALHIGNVAAAEEFIDPPTPYARMLMRKLWPGPVGMVFDVSEGRRQEAIGRTSIAMQDLYESGQITIRCPAHRTARDVLNACPHPIAAAPAGDDADRVDSIPQNIIAGVDMILDDGPVKHGKPSTLIKVLPGDFAIIRAGVYDRRIIDKMLQTTILFVCSGNTCRSPMAEAITRKLLSDSLKIPVKELERGGYTVISAGASAMSGSPASANAVEAVREYGANLNAHRSRLLTLQIVNQANIIFAMGRSHIDAVLMLNPSAKVMLLDVSGDIEDPIGGELVLYKNLAARIKVVVEGRLADQSLLGMEKKL